jgi:hypothetical protein
MLSDTPPEIEQLMIERLRQATPAERMQAAIGMSQLVIRMSRMAMIRLHPDWTDEQLAREYVRIHYGETVAKLLSSPKRSETAA